MSTGSGKSRRKITRQPRLEVLETRQLFASLPFGALPADTGEFMLGRIAVTPVLLESDGSIDQNQYDWSSAQIQEVLANLQVGLQWWDDLLQTKTTVHDLEWVIDNQFAVDPVESGYEPISRVSNDYRFWVREFLDGQGYNATGSIDADMRLFNDAQRQRLGTDWSFTIFVANSHFDPDQNFAQGGSFSRAFAFAGGLYFVTPSTRPASTYTHETGHMFWARDEYLGGGSYTQRRGYYNTQNWNAADNPTPGFVQQPSIMTAGGLLQNAYNNLVSAPSTLEQLGWRDSDSDGIFDVLDVPIQMQGQGYWDEVSGTYRFSGSAQVGTLPNINVAGLRNDITINKISKIEYRLDGGAWQTALNVNDYTANLDLQIPIGSGINQIEIRAVGNIAGIESTTYTSNSKRPNITNSSGISGVAWVDDDRDQVWDSTEFGRGDWFIDLVDNQGTPISLQTVFNPDVFSAGELPNNFSPKVVFSSTGTLTDGRVGFFNDSTGSLGKTFHAFSPSTQAWSSVWTDSNQRLQANFAAATSQVEVDVIGTATSSVGRLEAYNSAGQLVARATTGSLTSGQRVTLRVGRLQNDIAYVIVGAHGSGKTIRIDDFRMGATSSVATNNQGQYRFENLPAGTYYLKARPSSTAYHASQPATGMQMVTLVAGSPVSNVDFSYQYITSPWQNPENRFDVDDNNAINAIDALVIINELNRGGNSDLSLRGLSTPPFVDVTGEGFLTAIDALQVINYLNSRGAGEGGDNSNQGGSGSGGSAFGSNGGNGDNNPSGSGNSTGGNNNGGNNNGGNNTGGSGEGEPSVLDNPSSTVRRYALPTGRLQDVLQFKNHSSYGPIYVDASIYYWDVSMLDEEEEHGEDDHDCEHDHSLMTDLVMTEWDDFG
jgi:hypothetical protein